MAADRATLRVETTASASTRRSRPPCHGLRGLRERLALAGGTCTIVSAAGHGTVVVVELPTGVAPNVPAADLPVGSAFSVPVRADLAPNPITGAAQ